MSDELIRIMTITHSDTEPARIFQHVESFSITVQKALAKAKESGKNGWIERPSARATKTVNDELHGEVILVKKS